MEHPGLIEKVAIHIQNAHNEIVSQNQELKHIVLTMDDFRDIAQRAVDEWESEKTGGHATHDKAISHTKITAPYSSRVAVKALHGEKSANVAELDRFIMRHLHNMPELLVRREMVGEKPAFDARGKPLYITNVGRKSIEVGFMGVLQDVLIGIVKKNDHVDKALREIHFNV